MHVFIIETNEFKDEIAKEYGDLVVNYPINSVADARIFQKSLTFAPQVKTAYILSGLSDAGEIAQTTLLKTLEEGKGENVVFLIPTDDRGKLLPTIQSRAQLIQKKRLEDNVYTTVDLSIQSLLEKISSISSREDAQNFIQGILKDEDTNLQVKREALTTLQALKANGNVTIQLLNFVKSLYVNSR